MGTAAGHRAPCQHNNWTVFLAEDFTKVLPPASNKLPCHPTSPPATAVTMAVEPKKAHLVRTALHLESADSAKKVWGRSPGSWETSLPGDLTTSTHASSKPLPTTHSSDHTHTCLVHLLSQPVESPSGPGNKQDKGGIRERERVRDRQKKKKKEEEGQQLCWHNTSLCMVKL